MTTETTLCGICGREIGTANPGQCAAVLPLNRYGEAEHYRLGYARALARAEKAEAEVARLRALGDALTTFMGGDSIRDQLDHNDLRAEAEAAVAAWEAGR